MKLCILIPFYNHGGAVGKVISSLKPFGLPLYVVDDGSDAEAKAALALALTNEPAVTLVTLPRNRGKGAAIMAGCDAARAAGFTHALQIDADGQHDINDIPKFIDAARRQPNALIGGQAVYDDSVPRARQYGRYVTHLWVWINTLSFTIKDSMCGLRMYPLASACEVWRGSYLSKRMEFDIEIIVRMAWAGVPVVTIPTRVTYPADGVSHFKMLRDNALISVMHARLFIGMVLRLPALLARRASVRA